MKVFFKLKYFFVNIFKNIPRTFLEYFLKSNHKSSQKSSGCGSCYPICTHMACLHGEQSSTLSQDNKHNDR
jgi:hypothetical protein